MNNIATNLEQLNVTGESHSEAFDGSGSKLTVSRMETGKSATHVWELKNWKETHNMLTQKTGCAVTIDDVKLWFSLRRHKESALLGDRLYTNEWYSLWVELLSDQDEVFCKVVAQFDDDTLATTPRKFESNLVIDRSEQKIKVEVVKEFILFSGWQTYVSDEGMRQSRYDKRSSLKYTKYYKSASELSISITASLFHFTGKNDRVDEIKKTINASDTLDIGSSELSKRMGALLFQSETTGLTDVQLKLKDGGCLYAHRAILANSSDVFMAMFTTDMKESHQPTVEIPDVTSNTMKVVLSYMYTGTVDRVSFQECIQELVYVASKYQLQNLLSYCDRTMGIFCSIENAVAFLQSAKRHNLPKAIVDVTNFIKSHSTKILLDMI